MTESKSPQRYPVKDGTSQQDRQVEALQPTYVEVEDRTVQELIEEAQLLAKELRFFDENNENAGDWELFLAGNSSSYATLSAVEKQIQRDTWARQLADYVENPERFAADWERNGNTIQPHVLLFATFLKLLGHLKKQINGLTKRHLDFYFLERLNIKARETTPDVVNLLLELADDIDQIPISKGTVFLGGADDEGNDLKYEADEDTIISRAKIAQLKNVFVDKQLITPSMARQNEGFEEMMKTALGSPNPGNSLPQLPEGVDDLLELESLLNQDQAAAISYINDQLDLTREEFQQLIDTEKDAVINGYNDSKWQPIYTILEVAYQRREIKKRQQVLRQIHESSDFQKLIRHIYGSPKPGDSLPIYQNTSGEFETVYADFTGEDEDKKRSASDYISDELKLTDSSFIFIHETSKATSVSTEDQEKFYQKLELSERQVRGVSFPAPSVEEISDVYASPDAKANSFNQYGDEDESLQFKTFGNPHAGVAKLPDPARMGFAISSPTLLLREGQRTITALLDLGIIPEDADELKKVLEDDHLPAFSTYISSAEEWVPVANVAFRLGNYLASESEGTHEGTIADGLLTLTESTLNLADTGKYFAAPTGDLYEITKVESETKAKVQLVGTVSDSTHDKLTKYASEKVYLRSLKIIIRLSDNDLPVEAYSGEAVDSYIQSQLPVLVLDLNHTPGEGIEHPSQSQYQQLTKLKVSKVHLAVDVAGVQNLQLQNDQTTLDARKPFEPFGSQPDVGNSLYLTNTELASKRIDKLELKFDWVKAPKSIKEHYASYWEVLGETVDYTDSSWAVSGFLHDRHRAIPLTSDTEQSGLPLFTSEGMITIADIPTRLKQTSPGYTYLQDDATVDEDSEVLAADRYFRLELHPVDFQHSIYPTVLARQTAAQSAEGAGFLPVNPPYDPKLKNLVLSYSATTDIVLEDSSASLNSLYQIYPFGYKKILDGTSAYMLPKYDEQGVLYLGISELNAPQNLSMLFQMAEGSANPEVEKPRLTWSYLKDNEWMPLALENVLMDTTNGFLNTGIVKLKLPADLTKGDTFLPKDFHWLKASVTTGINGISDTVAIAAQAISATLIKDAVAPTHFDKPLAPDSVAEAFEPIPEIASIAQPYTSSKGKPAEKEDLLYRRVSERIRHKNRAITLWDYEHMVLEKFPEVYKVKCISSNEEIGRADVVVIPDIRGKLPFNPFQPKVAADTLGQIQDYLDSHSPVFADVAVKNPFYLQVLTRCVVKFHDGLDEQFYKKKLVEEIRQLLSPWAYDTSSDISIGDTLHASTVINFIAERTYIDYVANLKLFQSENGVDFEDVRVSNNGKNVVTPYRPDMILVSAQSHVIEVMDENSYDEDSFEGIGYMRVQLDFEVS